MNITSSSITSPLVLHSLAPAFASSTATVSPRQPSLPESAVVRYRQEKTNSGVFFHGTKAYAQQQKSGDQGQSRVADAQSSTIPGKSDTQTSATGEGRKEENQTDKSQADATAERVRSTQQGELTAEELSRVQVLQAIDTKVKAHEMAHLSVAGSYAMGGVSFQYERGPDGRSYAVGGEVQIDTSQESTPRATITKMTVVRAAALAPADPSPQDRSVAAAATGILTEARQELRLDSLRQREDGADDAKEVTTADTGTPAAAADDKDAGAAGQAGGAPGVRSQSSTKGSYARQQYATVAIVSTAAGRGFSLQA